MELNDKSKPKVLVVATHNRDKVRELSAFLKPHFDSILDVGTYGFAGEIDETGATYAENAKIKVEACYEYLCLNRPELLEKNLLWLLADDSGFSVKALGGNPGVYSARYGGEISYVERFALLNNEVILSGSKERAAAFVCVLAVRTPEGKFLTFEGRLEGELAEIPKGDAGFGYDPIMYLPEYGATVAELPFAEKNRISHRAGAARAFADYLEEK